MMHQQIYKETLKTALDIGKTLLRVKDITEEEVFSYVNLLEALEIYEDGIDVEWGDEPINTLELVLEQLHEQYVSIPDLKVGNLSDEERQNIIAGTAIIESLESLGRIQLTMTKDKRIEHEREMARLAVNMRGSERDDGLLKTVGAVAWHGTGAAIKLAGKGIGATASLAVKGGKHLLDEYNARAERKAKEKEEAERAEAEKREHEERDKKEADEHHNPNHKDPHDERAEHLDKLHRDTKFHQSLITKHSHEAFSPLIREHIVQMENYIVGVLERD